MTENPPRIREIILAIFIGFAVALFAGPWYAAKRLLRKVRRV